MTGELDKIDLIRERMGVTYRDAKNALEEAGGDLVEALIKLEETKEQGWGNKLFDKSEDLVEEIRTYINKGNRTRVRLKRGEKTIADFPATVGVIGILAALASAELAVVAGIGTVAAMANKVTLEIEKEDGHTKVISLDRHREH
ncbi:MAG: hypothetical protein CVU89_02900 [Firmicutes bacterium HGW-Firmicutes-14]|nr:MAG: hypothetical protein CVU89_02900 [Firmicutes bacterium HGW-Firmicutes-14]